MQQPATLFLDTIWTLMENAKLASCQWGPVTAHGLGILTEMYVIYMERYLHTKNEASRSDSLNTTDSD